MTEFEGIMTEFEHIVLSELFLYSTTNNYGWSSGFQSSGGLNTMQGVCHLP